MLVEASLYRAGVGKEVSKVKRARACMNIVEKGLDFRKEEEDDLVDNGSGVKKGNGLIGTSDLISGLQDPNNPLSTWFTSMIGPQERRAFI